MPGLIVRQRHKPQTWAGLWLFGLFTALLPMLTIHLTWIISGAQGYLHWCNPYWFSCHSISATGRYGLAYFLFKGGMIPAIVLLAFYWWINHLWLRSLGAAGGRALFVLGIFASLALLVYSLSLGHAGDTFQLLRRTGVLAYLGFTFIAQVILGAALSGFVPAQGKRLLQLSGLTLMLAMASLLLDVLPVVDYKRMDNAVEWFLVLLLNLHAIAVAWLWKVNGLGLQLIMKKQVH
jgi:hypothetical protein